MINHQLYKRKDYSFSYNMVKPLSNQEKRKQLYNLSEDIRRCTSCPLWKGKTLSVSGDGSENAKVMFVYYSPSEEDDRQGTTLNDDIRKLYFDLLKKHKLKEKDVFVTPLIKCYSKRKNKVTSKCITSCKNKFLLTQIGIIKPNLIVLSSSKVIKSVLGNNYPLKKYNGKIVKKNNQNYLLTSNLI